MFTPWSGHPVSENVADVAKWLTHQIVALALAGSIPVVRPISFQT
jgi:hypothetical protein